MSASRLAALIALSAQPSSERRRALLREVTDLFIASDEQMQVQGSRAFDGVMEALSADLEVEVRAELARRLAPVPTAPRGALRRLANDDIAVAEPVLRQSTALTEADLLEVVHSRGQAHMRAVSGRRGLTESVSDVIVERGDDETVGVLLRNETAPLSRRSAEAVVHRAKTSPGLHEAVVERPTLPADLLNEMYFVVGAKLRREIARKNAGLDPAAIDAALAAGRRRLAERDGVLPPDHAEAEAHIKALKTAGREIGPALPAYLRAGERSRFVAGLADLAGVDFHTVARVADRRELDALAILCKSADLDRALFLALAVLIDEPGKGLAKASEYAGLYAELTGDTARRTLRFWRMRREGDMAA